MVISRNLERCSSREQTSNSMYHEQKIKYLQKKKITRRLHLLTVNCGFLNCKKQKLYVPIGLKLSRFTVSVLFENELVCKYLMHHWVIRKSILCAKVKTRKHEKSFRNSYVLIEHNFKFSVNRAFVRQTMFSLVFLCIVISCCFESRV